jgi:hypothetical protein
MDNLKLVKSQSKSDDKTEYFSEAELTRFARINANRYKTEIVELDGVKLGSRGIIQGLLQPLKVGGDYDPSTGEFVLGTVYPDELKYFEKCTPNGSYIAQNAFGVKVKVRRQNCEEFLVKDGDVLGSEVLLPKRGARIKMSPSQFRDFNKNGVMTRLEFKIGHIARKVTIDLIEPTDEPSFSNPVESRMKISTIYGSIEKIFWILPGERDATLIWSR